jgi:hypothetical protein
MPPGDPEKGFRSFRLLKKYLGSAGEGNEWHHIVEKSQVNKSGFSPYDIHNVDNIIKLDKTIHRAITGYYNSVQKFTSGQRVRDWLAGQSFDFETQYQFGIQTLKKYGVKIP